MLHLYLYSTAIFMLTAFLNLLTACLSPSLGLAAQEFIFLFIPILSIFLNQDLTSIFTYSSLTLVIVGNRHLPPGGILQERYLRGCRHCCGMNDSLCPLFTGYLSVSFKQESSRSLASKDNIFYNLLKITTPYTFTLS